MSSLRTRKLLIAVIVVLAGAWLAWPGHRAANDERASGATDAKLSQGAVASSEPVGGSDTVNRSALSTPEINGVVMVGERVDEFERYLGDGELWASTGSPFEAAHVRLSVDAGEWRLAGPELHQLKRAGGRLYLRGGVLNGRSVKPTGRREDRAEFALTDSEWTVRLLYTPQIALRVVDSASGADLSSVSVSETSSAATVGVGDELAPLTPQARATSIVRDVPSPVLVARPAPDRTYWISARDYSTRRFDGFALSQLEGRVELERAGAMDLEVEGALTAWVVAICRTGPSGCEVSCPPWELVGAERVESLAPGEFLVTAHPASDPQRGVNERVTLIAGQAASVRLRAGAERPARVAAPLEVRARRAASDSFADVEQLSIEEMAPLSALTSWWGERAARVESRPVDSFSFADAGGARVAHWRFEEAPRGACRFVWRPSGYVVERVVTSADDLLEFDLPSPVRAFFEFRDEVSESPVTVEFAVFQALGPAATQPPEGLSAQVSNDSKAMLELPVGSLSVSVQTREHGTQLHHVTLEGDGETHIIRLRRMSIVEIEIQDSGGRSVGAPPRWADALRFQDKAGAQIVPASASRTYIVTGTTRLVRRVRCNFDCAGALRIWTPPLGDSHAPTSHDIWLERGVTPTLIRVAAPY